MDIIRGMDHKRDANKDEDKKGNGDQLFAPKII
jgi:hypothetical protein